jgi:hypothetical protein
MKMKQRIFVLGCVAILLTGACVAQAAGNAAWVGVWQGELDGQPSVTLTLAEDTGELGGTVVFNMVSREDGSARVIGSEAHVLMHPHIDGRTLSFQVKQARNNRELHVAVTFTVDGKAQLRCLNCGEDSPVAELVRAQR